MIIDLARMQGPSEEELGKVQQTLGMAAKAEDL
jgi:hypothetical protein